MLVKAKWNVKDNGGWHAAGEVFQTEENLGEAVEILEKPSRAVVEAVPEEKPVQTPVQTSEKPRVSRRKNSAE